MKHRNATVALAICLICSLGASWASAEPPDIGDPRVFRSTNVPVVAVAALDSGRFVVANPDMINQDGQVTVGTVSTTNISIGVDTYTTFADSVFNPHIAALSSSNFVIAYGISFGAGGGGVVAGTVSGTNVTIDAANACIFDTGNVQMPTVAALDSSRFIIAFDSGNVGYPPTSTGKVIVGTVSGGTNISIVTNGGTVFHDSGNVLGAGITALDSNHFVISFGNASPYPYLGKLIAGTVDGTTIGVEKNGAETFDSRGISAGAIAAIDSETFAVAYCLNSSASGLVVAGSVSSDTNIAIVTNGSVAFDSGPAITPSIASLGNGRFAVTHYEPSAASTGKVVIGTVDGTDIDITLDGGVAFDSGIGGAGGGKSPMAALDSGRFVIAYPSSGAGKAVIGLSAISPSIDNEAATGITDTSATMNGTLTDDGGVPTTVRLYWGDNDGGTSKVSWDSNETFGVVAVGSLSTNISGLTGDTTYYYRFYATNSAGDTWASPTEDFTTEPTPVPPEVSNSVATSVGENSATLNGNLISTGSAATEVFVYWGDNDGGTSKVSWDSNETFGVVAVGSLSTNISGLTGDTTYYYRFYATNSAGDTWASPTEDFATEPTSGGPEVSNSVATSVGENSATLNGNLISTGSSPTEVFVYWGDNDGMTVKASWDNCEPFGTMDEGALSTNITGLTADTTYYFRFYASNSADEAWAAFPSASFETDSEYGSYKSELLTNPGYEDGLTGWTTFGDNVRVEQGSRGEVDGPHEGTNWLGRGNSTPVGGAYQVVSLSGYSNEIRAGQVDLFCMGWMNVDHEADYSRLKLMFVTDAGETNVFYDSGQVNPLDWVQYGVSNWAIPTNTVALRCYGEFHQPANPCAGFDDWTCRVKKYNGRPQIDSEEAGGITGASAFMNGAVISTGSASASVWLYWGTSDGANIPGDWDNVVYLGELSAGDIATEVTGLSGLTTYYYRHFASNTAGTVWVPGPAETFTTDILHGQYSEMLLLNPGYEDGLDEWTTFGDNVRVEQGSRGEVDGPHEGTNWLGRGNSTPVGGAYQDADLTHLTNEIVKGSAELYATGWMNVDHTSDYSRLKLIFYSSVKTTNTLYDSGEVHPTDWTQYGVSNFAIPSNTVRVRCYGEFHQPANPCAGFDDWEFRIRFLTIKRMQQVAGSDGAGVWTDFEICSHEVSVEEYVTFLNSYDTQSLISVSSGEVSLDAASDLLCLTTNAVGDAEVAYDSGAAAGSRFTAIAGRATHPMIFVTWFGSAAYCNWRTTQEGGTAIYDTSDGWSSSTTASGYRLPTESEWQKAAAWDHDRFVYFTYGTSSNRLSGGEANFLGSGDAYETGSVQTAPVGWYGTKSPYNLEDASGNAAEWCHDLYDSSDTDVDVDPHAVRGGSWGNLEGALRAASRSALKPETAASSVGFRILKK